MRIGIIDLGTNSVRFDVHQLGPGKIVRQLHREKIMVRLGQGVFLNGTLDRSAIQRTLHAFLRFRKIAAQYRATKVIAFGTSALREVSDRSAFLDELRARTGIETRVISGTEEAQLIALGILSNQKVPSGRFALLDIGGGSTEVIICSGKRVLHAHSFNLGTARLQQVFLKKSPPDPESIEALRRNIRMTLSEVMAGERWPHVSRVIGSSGTVRALSRLTTGSDGKTITRDRLRTLVRKISTMTTSDLLGVSGMEAKRVDMILAGAVLFEECLDSLGARKANPTEFSLRDGILEEERRLFSKGENSHLALHLLDIVEKAKSFGLEEEHILRVAELGGRVFDLLARVHRLPPFWKVYLIAALLLRDTGEAVCIAGHEEHSAYIVRHAELPAAEAWETELIAELCLRHEGSKLDLKGLALPRMPSLPGNLKKLDAFVKILLVLRVVDALDTGPQTVIQLKQVRVERHRVRIFYTGRNLTGLESILVEKHAPGFRKVFNRALEAIET